MKGLITDHHIAAAERWFPGIRRFYLDLIVKPRTFLELVWKYERHLERCDHESQKGPARPKRQVV